MMTLLLAPLPSTQHQGFTGYMRALGCDVDAALVAHGEWGKVRPQVEGALQRLSRQESGKRRCLGLAVDYCQAARSAQADELVRDRLFIPFATALTVGRVFQEVEVDVFGTPELIANNNGHWRIGEIKTSADGACPDPARACVFSCCAIQAHLSD